MQGLAAALEASDIATLLRRSRWTYPAVNAAHLFGVAMLVGAVVPMDLRLIGLWRADVSLGTTLRLLRPMAAAGAAIALPTGALLFVVQAVDYVALPLFAAKLALVALGLGHALAWGRSLPDAPRWRQQVAGTLSLVVWTGALVCGRVIGYL